MDTKIEISDIINITKKIILEKKINDESTSLVCYDFQNIYTKINYLKSNFPPNTLHAIAMKANPLVKVMQELIDMEVGIEAATLPELYIAHKTGFASDRIVFDSPAKTMNDLRFSLDLGCYINANSFSELHRINTILSQMMSDSKIGLRVNPQVGLGTIKSTSVAGKVSKFGVPIEKNRQQIIESYCKYDWLNGIHIHIGSQGISIEQLTRGLEKACELADEIDTHLSKLGRQIEFFDIGGGFPVSYHQSKTAPDIKAYIEEINKCVPKLFLSGKTVITEFGRYVYANSAFAISKVEYVKEAANHKILSIHLGADFLLRKAYNPSDWHHDISILDAEGNLKQGVDTKKYSVAGPLCFAGDFIAVDIELPVVEEGDFLIIHDVGAYTMSMWSRYNSRQIPEIIGFDKLKNQISTIRERETLDDLFNFWT